MPHLYSVLVEECTFIDTAGNVWKFTYGTDSEGDWYRISDILNETVAFSRNMSMPFSVWVSELIEGSWPT